MARELEKYFAYNNSNKERKTASLFYGKRLYYNELVKQKQPSYLDLWYKKPLYGKVDPDFNIVVPDANLMGRLNVRMITLSDGDVISTDDGSRLGSVHALDFVADAFNAMNLYMREQQQKGRMRANSFFTPTGTQRLGKH